MENDNLNKQPFCLAPFTSFKIDTNKGVRPCCAWTGNYFGNIEDSPIHEILQSTKWKLLQERMMKQEMPSGCMSCKLAEVFGGDSLRKDFNRNFNEFGRKEKYELIEIEIDSSNHCNLSCIHCSADYSDQWVPYEKLLQHDNFNSQRIRNPLSKFKIDEKLLTEQFLNIDIQNLKILRLKGGEPFLNKEIFNLINFLNEKEILQNINVHIITNGTIINNKFTELLTNAKSVSISISVDGTDKLQEYIRFGSSSLLKIHNFILNVSSLSNLKLYILPSIMIYNIYNLKDIEKWWNEIIKKFHFLNIQPCEFSHFVFWPNYLSVRVLPDEVRNDLINYYSEDLEKYDKVIEVLKQPWLGNYWLSKFREYTMLMEKYRGNNITSIVPEFKDVLNLDLISNENEKSTILQKILELDFIIKSNCQTAEIYLQRGILNREIGNKEQSIKDFKSAMDIDNNLYFAIPENWLY